MIASVFRCTVTTLILTLLASPAAGWGLTKSSANEQLEDIQLLPKSSTGAPAALRDHYWYNAKTGVPPLRVSAKRANFHQADAWCCQV